MLSKEEIAAQRNNFVHLLESTKREGVDKLITYLDDEGFFEAPASPGKIFHGCYDGGLCKHSLAVYDELVEKARIYKPQKASGFGQMQLKFTGTNLIIAGLLHDVCKVNAYQRTKDGTSWTNNRSKDKPKGHAKLSLERIQKFIKLEKIEMFMIKFHMGLYGCIEFQDEGKEDMGEYHLRGDHAACEGMSKEASKKYRYGKSLSNVYYHNPIVKVMSICDELATFKEKADEN